MSPFLLNGRYLEQKALAPMCDLLFHPEPEEYVGSRMETTEGGLGFEAMAKRSWPYAVC